MVEERAVCAKCPQFSEDEHVQEVIRYADYPSDYSRALVYRKSAPATLLIACSLIYYVPNLSSERFS